MSIALAVVGLGTGVLTGLLGIGGGIVLVPALMWLLPGTVPDAVLMKTCVATSLGVIFFSGSWASWLQHRVGNFDLDMTLKLSIGVAAGALIGSASSALAPEIFLRWFFIAFALYVGMQMLTPLLPTLDLQYNTKTAVVAGTLTGFICSLVGGGGATFVVPYLTFCKIDLKKAIGVATGVGVTTAFFSFVGYWLSAQATGVSRPGGLGYVDLATLVPLVVFCMVGAIGGVRLARYVNVRVLKRTFAVVLLASATKMAWSMLAP